MDQKVKVLGGILGFALVIVFAVFAYNFLAEDNEPDSFVVLNPPAEVNEPVYVYEEEVSPSDAEDDPEPDEQRVPAPDFIFEDADGNERRLSDFLGTPVVLNFWASWCPSCVVEKPYFSEMYQEYGDRVQFLKINLADGVRETREGVQTFMYENGYTTPLFFDVSGAATYGVRGIPITFYIDAEGYAVAMAQGAQRRDQLQQGIAFILGE